MRTTPSGPLHYIFPLCRWHKYWKAPDNDPYRAQDYHRRILGELLGVVVPEKWKKTCGKGGFLADFLAMSEKWWQRANQNTTIDYRVKDTPHQNLSLLFLHFLILFLHLFTFLRKTLNRFD